MQTRVAITTNIVDSSVFADGTACTTFYLADIFAHLGYHVTLLALGNTPWFTDIQSLQPNYKIEHVVPDQPPKQPFDVVIESAWSFSLTQRPQWAKTCIFVCHDSPLVDGIESCAYLDANQVREFSGLHAVWLWDHCSENDVQYVKLLADPGTSVRRLRLPWSNNILDTYLEAPAGVSKQLLWPIRALNAHNKGSGWMLTAVESNTSITGSSVFPWVAMNEINRTLAPKDLRCWLFNAHEMANSTFFKNNIYQQLHMQPSLDDESVFAQRVRLPDLTADKIAIFFHQRLRPMRTAYLDAMWLGIPLIHNSPLLPKDTAIGGYYYHENSITQSLKAFANMNADFEKQAAYFTVPAIEKRNQWLDANYNWRTATGVVSMYGMAMDDALAASALAQLNKTSKLALAPSLVNDQPVIRIWFTDFWADFNPMYNFFTLMIGDWLGRFAGGMSGQTPPRILLDNTTPHILLYGPFGTDHQKYKCHKVFFTGENTRPRPEANLNIGFDYRPDDPAYIRLPLWVLMLDWYNANAEQIRNPVPIAPSLVSRVHLKLVRKKTQFCAFVVSNPCNPVRNEAFAALSKYKPVVSAGGYMNNVGKKLDGGLGGGGGERVKVEFYEQFKFVIAYENAEHPGYVTEKMLHAKAAGAVPIYWGDPLVAREFNPAAFIHARDFATVEDLVAHVAKVDEDDQLWLQYAATPLFGPERLVALRQQLDDTASRIINLPQVLPPSGDITRPASVSSAAVVPLLPSGPETKVEIEPDAEATGQRQLVTAFAGGQEGVDACLKTLDTVCCAHNADDATMLPYSVLAYALGAVTTGQLEQLSAFGVHVVQEPSVSSRKNVLLHALDHADKGTAVLFLDGLAYAIGPLDTIFDQIAATGCFVLERARKGGQIDDSLMGAVSGSRQHRVLATAAEATTKADGIKTRVACLEYDQWANDASLNDTLLSGNLVYLHGGTPRQRVETGMKGIDAVVVINLLRRKDRATEFADAHPDLHMTWQDGFDAMHAPLFKEMAHLFRDNVFGWQKGVVGCAASHYAVLQRLRCDPNPAAHYLIMEDDARMSEAAIQKWNAEMADQMPTDADLVFLGGILPPNRPAWETVDEPVPDNPLFGRIAPNTFASAKPRRTFHFCAYAYILTQAGADKLHARFEHIGIRRPYDHELCNPPDVEDFRVYYTRPFLAGCKQEADPRYNSADFDALGTAKYDTDVQTGAVYSKAEIEAAFASDSGKDGGVSAPASYIVSTLSSDAPPVDITECLAETSSVCLTITECSTAVQPKIEVAVEPAVQPKIEQTVEPAIQPKIEQTVEPAVQPEIEQTVEPAIQPEIEVAVRPEIEQTLEPAIQPEIEQAAELQIEENKDDAFPSIVQGKRGPKGNKGKKGRRAR
jgi:GR25 family glycosyltransferase involved in LPS biosynthesis